MLRCARMPVRMHIHVHMLSALGFMTYEPSVLRLVAVVATGQQDAGSRKTLHALLLRVDYRLSGAANMLSRKCYMLHEKNVMQMHVRGHGHAAFEIQLSPCV